MQLSLDGKVTAEKWVTGLDGIEQFDSDSFIVSDWVAGKVFRISRSGEAKRVWTPTVVRAEHGFAVTRSMAPPVHAKHGSAMTSG